MKKTFGYIIFFLLTLFLWDLTLNQSQPQAAAGQALPRYFEAPEFVGLTDWINSEEIRSIKDLRGKVVLVDFWTFGCINCIHTLPYVQAWHEKFKEQGLIVLGVHAPEFGYERKKENVLKAVKKYGLTYPVVIDNGFNYWRSYRNRYWPAFFLIDKKGVVRYKHFGEGRYGETEAAIMNLLGES